MMNVYLAEARELTAAKREDLRARWLLKKPVGNGVLITVVPDDGGRWGLDLRSNVSSPR